MRSYFFLFDMELKKLSITFFESIRIAQEGDSKLTEIE